MDERDDLTDTALNQIQNITLFAGGPFGNGTGSTFEDFADGTFAITFRSLLNESYTTYPLRLDTSMGASAYSHMEVSQYD